MKKLILFMMCAFSVACIAQQKTSIEDEFHTTSKPASQVEIYWGSVPSGDKVDRTFIELNAKQSADEPVKKIFIIVSYHLQINNIDYAVSGSKLTDDMKKAINLAPTKTKLTGLFKVQDEEGVIRSVTGTWELI